MSEQIGAGLARRLATGQERRAIFGMTAGAALAVIRGATGTSAKKKGKKKKKCGAQGNVCKDIVGISCEEPSCLDLFLPCCELHARCKASDARVCLAAAAEE